MSRNQKTPKTAISAVSDIDAWSAFDQEGLRRICEMPEDDFAKAYDMELVPVAQDAPADFYCYRDNGSNVLAVAHLDTVGLAKDRGCHFLNTQGGPVVYSRALDDRLGAYIILDLLPQLGITHDILLTVGEEEGRSTASFFEPPKDYDWMIEFDRGGTDVVMYDYEDALTVNLVRASGARVGQGSFSDICYLEHLGIKGFNWGVGYQDYHGPRAHAYLDDTLSMVEKYLTFHEANATTAMPHIEHVWPKRQGLWGGGASWLNSDAYADEYADELDKPQIHTHEDDDGDMAFARFLGINR